jgi:hypothetical protein
MRRLIVLATFAFIHLLTTAAYAVEFMPQTDAGKGRSYSPVVEPSGYLVKQPSLISMVKILKVILRHKFEQFLL